jgi:hypothetical protein
MPLALLTVILLQAGALYAQKPSVVSKQNARVVGTNKANTLLAGIDPAVTSITFATVKLSNGDKLKITGTVTNKGNSDYESGDNQQMIQLWEIRSPGDRQMLRQILFSRLNSGQELKITHEVPYPKKGKEAIPEYQVVIVYDPDILSDANKKNDDSNSSNNTMTKKP